MAAHHPYAQMGASSGTFDSSKSSNGLTTASSAGSANHQPCAPAAAHPPGGGGGGFNPSPSNPRASLLRIVGPPAVNLAIREASGLGGRTLAPAPTAVGGVVGEHEEASSILVGLRLGDFGGRVGLLPGLRPRFMDKYAPPGETQEKKRRAPREDLTGFTAEEKVRRRNERARIYTCQARQRAEEQQRELEKELGEFRLYAALVEQAPQVGLLVMRADLHAVVLYGNAPFEQLLGLRHEAILGQPFWSYLHPGDHAQLASAMGDLILTLVPPKKSLRCRLRRLSSGPAAAAAATAAASKRKKGLGSGGAAAPGLLVVKEADGTEYVRVSLNLRNGTQGLVCSVWPEAQW